MLTYSLQIKNKICNDLVQSPTKPCIRPYIKQFIKYKKEKCAQYSATFDTQICFKNLFSVHTK